MLSVDGETFTGMLQLILDRTAHRERDKGMTKEKRE